MSSALRNEVEDLQAEIEQLKHEKLRLEARLAHQDELLQISINIIEEMPETIWWEVRTVPQLRSFLTLFGVSQDLSNTDILSALREVHDQKIMAYILKVIKPSVSQAEEIIDQVNHRINRGSEDDWKAPMILAWLVKYIASTKKPDMEDPKRLLSDLKRWGYIQTNLNEIANKAEVRDEVKDEVESIVKSAIEAVDHLMQQLSVCHRDQLKA